MREVFERIRVEDLNDGDIFYEEVGCDRCICRASKKPLLEEDSWCIQGVNLLTHEIVDFGQNKRYPGYGPRLYLFKRAKNNG